MPNTLLRATWIQKVIYTYEFKVLIENWFCCLNVYSKQKKGAVLNSVEINVT